MIAIAKIGGHQALVKVGDQLQVDKLDAKEGSKVSFETLLISEEDGKNFELGTPVIQGKEVEAKVIEHGRTAKIRVFKMKPRKRYRRTLGHRQDYTVVEIVSIGGITATKKTSVSSEKKEKKPEGKPVIKKAPAKKPATKKTVAKNAKKS